MVALQRADVPIGGQSARQPALVGPAEIVRVPRLRVDGELCARPVNGERAVAVSGYEGGAWIFLVAQGRGVTEAQERAAVAFLTERARQGEPAECSYDATGVGPVADGRWWAVRFAGKPEWLAADEGIAVRRVPYALLETFRRTRPRAPGDARMGWLAGFYGVVGDRAEVWLNAGLSGAAYLEVLAHEIGHAVGWDDEDDAEAFGRSFVATRGTRAVLDQLYADLVWR